MTSIRHSTWLIVLGCVVSYMAVSVSAQTVIESRGGAVSRTQIAQPSGGQQPSSGEPKSGPQASANQAKGKDAAKAADGNDDAAEAAEAEKDTAGPKPITRPAADQPAESEPIRIEPDTQGRVQLQLRQQPWVEVLQLLADWAGVSLDWTELPGDSVNLATSKKYTLNEAKGLFNRMLLDRGYTMLFQPGTLSVHKLSKLNAALVPRVDPKKLEQRDPYEWVRASFTLDPPLNAEQVVKDLELMKSQHGSLKALKATNRVQAIDTAINLRHMRDVLMDEMAAQDDVRHVRVFQIEHRAAIDVESMLRELLGLKPRQVGQEDNTPMTPQQMQMQMKMQQMQMQQQQNAKQAQASTEDKQEARLVVNPRQNTILAHASPTQLALIEQAIEAVDVPSGVAQGLNEKLLRFHSYKLAAIDPGPLVSILREVGGLDVRTRLEVDDANKAIIAYAPLVDHVTIRALVQRLDGSSRSFHVRKLRRLRADYVAGTIAFMMGLEEEDDSRNRRPVYFYGYGNNREDEKEDDKFSVDADTENNWLLLRANEAELSEIENLLVQLGEVRVPGSDDSKVRYIEAAPGEETEQMLRRLQQMWPSIAPNPLRIEPAQPDVEPTEQQPTDEQDQSTDEDEIGVEAGK